MFSHLHTLVSYLTYADKLSVKIKKIIFVSTRFFSKRVITLDPTMCSGKCVLAEKSYFSPGCKAEQVIIFLIYLYNVTK
jgi:hypothetical protein